VKLPGRRPGPRPVGLRPAGGRTPGDRPAGARAGRSGGAHPARGLLPVGRAWPSIRLPRPTRLPRFTPARAGALLGIIASLGAIYGLAATTAFTYARAEIPELRWTSPDAVEAAIGIPSGTNLFRITVAPIEDRIETLPGVAHARVMVALPDTLVVDVTEREAIAASSRKVTTRRQPRRHSRSSTTGGPRPRRSRSEPALTRSPSMRPAGSGRSSRKTSAASPIRSS
jgi:hypothetical protein